MATVLVVEDEFGVADLIEAVLEDEGYRRVLAHVEPVRAEHRSQRVLI